MKKYNKNIKDRQTSWLDLQSLRDFRPFMLALEVGMPINVERISGYLEAMANMNDGIDHSCSYWAEAIEYTGDLEADLAGHLKKSVSVFRGNKEIFGSWEVKLSELENPMEEFFKIARRYFFEEEFSPSPRSKKYNSVSDMMDGFEDFIGECTEHKEPTIFRVKSESNEIHNDPVYHEFLMKIDDSLCLIHFGYSD